MLTPRENLLKALRHEMPEWIPICGHCDPYNQPSRQDGTSYRVEHFLKGPQDLPAFAAMFEDQIVELNPERLAALKEHRERIGDDGIIGVTLPGTPLGMLVRVYAGVETTAFLCADAPGALANLFTVMERRYSEMFRLAASTHGDALITVDDTSTTTISPTMFERYCIDYTNRMADIAHAGGKLYFHHSCGLIRNLLSLYRPTRMDAVHAFTIPPIGDVTVKEGKAKLGPGIAIFAGLFQLLGSADRPEQMESVVREMFEGAAPGDNFVLGLAADPNITMADTQKLVEICRKYQRPTERPRPIG